MSVIYIGIDPGVTGAVAVIANPGAIAPHLRFARYEVLDMPTIDEINSRRKQNRVWGKALFQTIDTLPEIRSNIVAIIEKTHPMKDSAMTAFSMGMSRMATIMALELACIKFVEVAPNVWKKHFKLTKCDKDASRTLAIQRFPELTDQLKLKKHHNRSEALLLALYGKEINL